MKRGEFFRHTLKGRIKPFQYIIRNRLSDLEVVGMRGFVASFYHFHPVFTLLNKTILERFTFNTFQASSWVNSKL